MKSFHLKTVVLLIVLSFFSCQNFYRNKAGAAEQKREYKVAIAYLKKCNELEYHPETDLKIADLFFKMDELDSSKAYYSKVFESHGSFQTAVLPYAITLFYKQEYEEVKSLLKIYDRNAGSKGVPSIIAAMCNSVLQQERSLFNVRMNIKENQVALFSLEDYRDGSYSKLITSHFDGGAQSSWTEAAYAELLRDHISMDGNWFTEDILGDEARNRIFDGPESYSNDGKTVFFSRSCYTHNDELEAQMKIFTASKVNEAWTEMKGCPFNSEQYSIGHPSVARDSDKVYFTSDMPGGFGGFDLYYSLVKDGTWSQPINLGEQINTAGNEFFPFIDSNNLLFYVSDHRTNPKQLDVHISYDDGTKWLTPQVLNFKSEIVKNDFGYRFDQANIPVLLTIDQKPPDARPTVFNLSGIAIEKGSEKPVKGALIQIHTGRTGERIEIYSDENGVFRYELEENLEYSLVLKNENSLTKSTAFSTKNQRQSIDFLIRYEVEKIKINVPYLIEDQLFDNETWTPSLSCKNALDDLFDLMSNNSLWVVEISAHTDADGDANYNQILSEMRAKAAVEYLSSQGINERRLRYKGYGESEILNRCGEDVQCTEAEKAINRRLEYTIISN